MARSVKDLRSGLLTMAGRHIEDPQSVTVPFEGHIPQKPKAALVTKFENHTIDSANVEAIEKAGKILSDKGWEVEEVDAPETERVYEIWHKVLNSGMLDEMPEEAFKPETADYLRRFEKQFPQNDMNLDQALLERRRLRRLWSAFLTDYQVCIGPTWANRPWPIDTDLDPDVGIQTLKESFIFISPGNCLGLPSVALPMEVHDGLPTGIQIYSELYREDLCLAVAEMIQDEVPCPTPIDPV